MKYSKKYTKHYEYFKLIRDQNYYFQKKMKNLK